MPTYNNGYVRQKNDHPISFDEQGNLTDQITGEKGTMMLPGFTITGISPETRARNYSSAYHPEDALEFLDIMTRPLTRPFSVSQQIGAIRNKINGGTYLGSLLGNKENLGIVSKNFNKEHPYLSTAANIGIDLLTPSAISKVSKIAQTVPKTVGQKYVAPYILSKMLNRSIKANPNIRDINNLFNTNFINRNTVFGKNSGKAIHADYGDNIGGFTKGTTGASINNGKLIPGHNPNTEVDYIWWNVDKPYATGINGRTFTRYIIKDEKSIPRIINIREQSKPIGQWNGKSGFVSKSERVTQEPVSLDDATIIEYNPITRVYENKLIVPDKRLNINTSNSFDLSNLLYKNLSNHLQGEEAVKMFKQYGGIKIPEGSINGKQLRKYVQEARIRYGLINNKNITDEEIAQSLYKHVLELGKGSAAKNIQGEPQLLFRGDTRRYTELKPRPTPEELEKMGGTMDNSLGNLFLGQMPESMGGLERYIVHVRDFGGDKRIIGSGTGSKAVLPDGNAVKEFTNDVIGTIPEGSYQLYSYPYKYGNISAYKLPASWSESGVNDINAFVVRTPNMRNASKEISVLNDDFIIQGGSKVNYYGPIRRKVLDKDGFPQIIDETGKVVGDGLAGSSDRSAMAKHYRQVLDKAKNEQQGLLKSDKNSLLRDEHDNYDYFALPNFNIRGAKHILPYDLRIPRDWNDPNIYKAFIPIGVTAYGFKNN